MRMSGTRAGGVWGWVGIFITVACAGCGGALQSGQAPSQDEARATEREAGDVGGEDRVETGAGGGMEFEGITIDREAGYVDLDATVVLRDAEWLELILCSPGTREHESILTSPARPSQIHLALLMLGLENGQPMVQRRVADQFDVQPPRGQAVELFYVMDVDGHEREIPANEWVYDRKAEGAMEGNVWLFAGSAMQEFEGEVIYMADLNGTIASLVNFGDDVLARPTALTHMSDEEQFDTYTERIPEEGTELSLRIRPAEADADNEQDFE